MYSSPSMGTRGRFFYGQNIVSDTPLLDRSIEQQTAELHLYDVALPCFFGALCRPELFFIFHEPAIERIQCV